MSQPDVRVLIADEPEDSDAPSFVPTKAEALTAALECAKEIRAHAEQLLREGLEPGEMYGVLVAASEGLQNVAAALETIPSKDELWSMLSDWLVGHQLNPTVAEAQS